MQIKTFWEQLSWPDAECAATFVQKMIEVGQVDVISVNMINSCLSTGC